MYPKIELTKVVLQCSIENINQTKLQYYKITKKLFNDEPYKIYSTDAVFKNGKYSPMIDGYWNQSEEVELASENVTTKKYISQYSYPDWYTFVYLIKEKSGLYTKDLNFFISINRETLELESHFFNLSDKMQCVISDDKHFDESYESDKNSKLKNKKI